MCLFLRLFARIIRLRSDLNVKGPRFSTAARLSGSIRTRDRDGYNFCATSRADGTNFGFFRTHVRNFFLNAQDIIAVDFNQVGHGIVAGTDKCEGKSPGGLGLGEFGNLSWRGFNRNGARDGRAAAVFVVVLVYGDDLNTGFD